jgi:hypothetical protein
MNESEEDAGIIQVLAMRLETQRLPRALALKEKVDGGERLNDMDIAFLDEVFSDTARIKPMIDRHPEWQKVFIQMVQLYEGILSKAKENEQGTQ